jgi:hypothetical protein
MNTPLSTKLAAVALALLMNGTMLGGIAVLFSAPSAQAATITVAA